MSFEKLFHGVAAGSIVLVLAILGYIGTDLREEGTHTRLELSALKVQVVLLRQAVENLPPGELLLRVALLEQYRQAHRAQTENGFRRIDCLEDASPQCP